MDRWQGRVALVTGASAGIGASIAKELVVKGMKVVAVARRLDRLQELKQELRGDSGELHALKCDVRKEEDILEVFAWIKKNLGGVDVLINNAGLSSTSSHLANSKTETDQWKMILDTNVLGLSIFTREAITSMQSRGVDDGHIVHINSICGHSVLNRPGNGMYTASKYGVTALTEALRKELVALKSRIRVTSVSPGIVKTEFAVAAGAVKNADDYYDVYPHLLPEDIADAVVYVLGVPAHVQIHELTIKPVGEIF